MNTINAFPTIFLIIITIILSVVLISGICWKYTINTWLEYYGKEKRIVLWQACLFGVVPGLGQLSIPGAAATWLFMMFLEE